MTYLEKVSLHMQLGYKSWDDQIIREFLVDAKSLTSVLLRKQHWGFWGRGNGKTRWKWRNVASEWKGKDSPRAWDQGSADTLISEFWTVALRELTFCCFKPPSSWYFVTAAPEDHAPPSTLLYSLQTGQVVGRSYPMLWGLWMKGWVMGRPHPCWGLWAVRESTWTPHPWWCSCAGQCDKAELSKQEWVDLWAASG